MGGADGRRPAAGTRYIYVQWGVGRVCFIFVLMCGYVCSGVRRLCALACVFSQHISTPVANSHLRPLCPGPSVSSSLCVLPAACNPPSFPFTPFCNPPTQPHTHTHFEQLAPPSSRCVLRSQQDQRAQHSLSVPPHTLTMLHTAMRTPSSSSSSTSSLSSSRFWQAQGHYTCQRSQQGLTAAAHTTATRTLAVLLLL